MFPPGSPTDIEKQEHGSRDPNMASSSDLSTSTKTGEGVTDEKMDGGSIHGAATTEKYAERTVNDGGGDPQHDSEKQQSIEVLHQSGGTLALDNANPSQPIDLGNNKIYLGTDARTGKAIVQDKSQTIDGPFTRPGWRHSLPFFKMKHPPPPPPKSVDDAPLIPDLKANIISQFLFMWITPIMALGAQRPLTAEDLWKLDEKREAKYLSGRLSTGFQKRWDDSEIYNEKLERGEIKPPVGKKIRWALGGGKGKNRAEKEQEWRQSSGKKSPSLFWALSDVHGTYFWYGGLYKVVADTLQVTSPLLVKALIQFSTNYHYAQENGTAPPSIGRGVGMAIGLFCMLMASSICMNQFFLRSAGTGVLARSALISALYERALRLSGKARIAIPNGQLVNHISTDVSRIDFAAGFAHMAWTAPIQFIICCVILLVEIQESALVGIAFLVIFSPIQKTLIKYLFAIRVKAMRWTDKRAKLLQELLGGMKIVKLMAWEGPFLERLGTIRTNELGYVRTLLISRSANMAIATSIPVIAAILSFITYGQRHPDLPAAKIFTVITLFNMLRLPLMIFPMALSAITDAFNALGRIQKVFMADTITETLNIDEQADFAIKASHASWSWDSVKKPEEVADKKKGGNPFAAHGNSKGTGQKSGGGRFKRGVTKPFKWIKDRKTGKITLAQEEHVEIAAGEPGIQEAGDLTAVKQPGLPEQAGNEPTAEEEEEDIFTLNDIDIEIPRGAFVAVVGAIGSGKSSLLSGLMGEMRRTEGKVVFGSPIAICNQVPWITNATVRENILFGRPFDEERYWKAVKDACLETDLEILEGGDATEIGEKGINLSGGQKARVNIARALYFDAPIMLFDDALAAVDPAVAVHLFKAIASLKNRTRVLVTHALHFLSEVDYVICMHNGNIAERGTYTELKAADGPFARLIREFANDDEEEEKKEEEEEAIEEVEEWKPVAVPRAKMTANVTYALISREGMHTGGMSRKTYFGYLKAGRGWLMLPLIVSAVVVAQAFTIMTSFWLVYWQEKRWGLTASQYEGTYIALGLGSAISIFAMGASQAFFTYLAALNLHKRAINRVMHAKMSWFDTELGGRIMNRLTKDVDTLDNTLGDAMRMLISTLASIIGAVILIAIVEPYFLIAVLGISLAYVQLAAFYQKSALSFKRIDAVLRSPLYAHFSESLSGTAVIRAFGETRRFVEDNCRYNSLENRAYFLTIVNQRWLGVRLDFLGTLLTFAVALIVVLTRGISPANGGLILSYMVTTQQSFTWLCRQWAEVANDLNSAERLLEYGNDLEVEAPHVIEETKPPASWPSEGRIDFNSVVMSYRPGLPAVLKNLDLHVRPAEKIGVVGRTGAGKSSLMTTLFRLVELTEGSIEIDGIDISKIGLTDLRNGLSIIPQEPLLFSGTIRSNLDPFGIKTDPELWDAMHRAHLVDSLHADIESSKAAAVAAAAAATDDPLSSSGTYTPIHSRFTLDTVVEDEGQNLSVGQRSLVSLARALVRDAKIVVLDEATASVDLETDARIQETIRTEFADKTLLCIAHRIRTILSYDRILVMNAGTVEEFDTPMNLFRKQDGAFRAMCEKSSITIEDVEDAAGKR